MKDDVLPPNRFDLPVLCGGRKDKKVTSDQIPALPVIREFFAQMGRKGGSAKSAKKTASCKRNGFKKKPP